MASVKVFYDQTGNTLTVWLNDSQGEYICEETGDEVILMKNKLGNVIGFEKLNFTTTQLNPIKIPIQISFETLAIAA